SGHWTTRLQPAFGRFIKQCGTVTRVRRRTPDRGSLAVWPLQFSAISWKNRARSEGERCMLRIDRANRTMMRLGPKPLATAGILERNDLQQMIKNAPAEFFAELGEQLLPLGEEIRPSEVVDDRIDLLALDADGAAVIIELK